MVLNDLLSLLRRDMLHDRSSQVAGDSDKLWSDTTLVTYINEAQNELARQTLCLRDAVSSVTQFQLAPYQENYALDPSILAVISARYLGNTRWIDGVQTPGAIVNGAFVPNTALPILPIDRQDMTRVGHDELQVRQSPDTYFFNPDMYNGLPPGKPLAFDTDEGVGVDTNGSSGVMSMRVYPIPSTYYAPATIAMRVARLPLVPLTVKNMDAVPEVPAIYHLYLLEYAAYLALRISDIDLGDGPRAKDYLQTFEGRVEAVKKDMRDKMRQPLKWKFGRGGFSYPGN